MNSPSSSFESNLAEAEALLAPRRREALPHIIGGRSLQSRSGATFDNLSPIDGRRTNRVAAGGALDVDAAAAAAAAAFRDWRALPADRRRAILHRIADGIEACAGGIAMIESLDTGQPIRFTSKAATRGAENFRFFADRAPSARDGLSLPADRHLNYTLRQPIGPVGIITPWNTPFMLSTWKIAPALAAGCTVVHKPAEWSPLSANLLAEIASEAGLPDGVLNVVHGTGEDAGRALTEHPEVKAIAFVGGTETGRLIMAQGAPTLKRVHCELGGKNPVIVFADADLERAIDAVVFMIYSLNGERCNSGSRLLVERRIADTFVARVAERARAIRVGHPLDPATEMGPLIHPEHRDKVLGSLEVARREGAGVVAGGGVPPGFETGNYVAPTLLTGTPDMRIARDEIFGPVLTAIPFDAEADAVRIANATRYGLSAYVWTENLGRAHRVAEAAEAGMVWINSEIVRHLPSPFGGMKASGLGRDGGDWSFDFYMETKNVCLALGTHDVPRLGVSP